MMCSGTASLPMSCKSAAACSASISSRRHTQFFGYLDGIHPDPLQVIVRGVVLGFDRQRQRFDGAQVQVGHLFDVALFVFQFSQI